MALFPRSIFALLLILVVGCSSSKVTRSLGARCEVGSDCDDRCVTGQDYPDGLCTLSCAADADCPGDSDCIDEEGGICLFSCEEDPDCDFLGAGWMCQAKDRRGLEEEVLVCFGQ